MLGIFLGAYSFGRVLGHYIWICEPFCVLKYAELTFARNYLGTSDDRSSSETGLFGGLIDGAKVTITEINGDNSHSVGVGVGVA